MPMPPNRTAQGRLRRIIAELQAVASEIPTAVAARTCDRSPTSADGEARLASADLGCIQNISRRGSASSPWKNGVSSPSGRFPFTPVHPL